MGKHNATQRGMQMRTWIGIAVVVAIGLIWSLAAMSELVPVNSVEMRSTAPSPYAGDLALKPGG